MLYKLIPLKQLLRMRLLVNVSGYNVLEQNSKNKCVTHIIQLCPYTIVLERCFGNWMFSKSPDNATEEPKRQIYS